MKERLARQLDPEVHQAIRMAQRACGKEPLIKRVDTLPQETRAMLRRPPVAHRPYEILYRRGEERVLDHLIAHEIGHIVRLHQVPESGRLAAAATPECRTRAIRQLIPELVDLVKRGVPEDILPDLVADRYEAICGQVANFPADLRIEQWIHDRFPNIRRIQRQSLTEEVERSAPLFLPEVAASTPPTIYQAQMAMNAAQAHHVARLYNNPGLVEPFTRYGFAALGERLTQIVFDTPDHGHRSDMEATNTWARKLDLVGWFEWQLPTPADLAQFWESIGHP